MHKQLLTFIRVSTLVILLNACGQQNDINDYESVNEYLLTLSGNMNKNLPDMADDNTVLERTNGSNLQFSYYYTLLNYIAREVDVDAFVNQMNPLLLQSTCSSALLKPLVSRGVTIQYVYADKDREEFARIAIPADECGNT
jgi:hypothetical protein